ncbi:response regulator [Streptomyces sp. NPDC001307]|uniref:response regulator n=1 Tax=Streptomyces sp. NPDC001307 TaxID=3364560 RepID=UPI00368B28F2
MTSNPWVLVVDDVREDGRSYAEMLEATTGLATAYVATVEETLALVRGGEIVVAVLDQRMEQGLGVDGTSLMTRIWEADPDVRIVIFSGESRRADIITATERGAKFLDKGRIRELPGLVHRLHAEYLAQAARRYQDTVPVPLDSFRGSRWLGRSEIVAELLHIEKVAPKPSAEDADYQLLVQLIRGQETQQTVTKSYQTDEKIDWESRLETKIPVRIGPATIARIEAQVTGQLKRNRHLGVQRSLQEQRQVTYKLPDEDIAAGVAARRIQRAPLYWRMRAMVRVRCDCCGLTNTLPLGFRIQSGWFTERQQDTMTDGSVNTLHLGQD